MPGSAAASAVLGAVDPHVPHVLHRVSHASRGCGSPHPCLPGVEGPDDDPPRTFRPHDAGSNTVDSAMVAGSADPVDGGSAVPRPTIEVAPTA